MNSRINNQQLNHSKICQLNSNIFFSFNLFYILYISLQFLCHIILKILYIHLKEYENHGKIVLQIYLYLSIFKTHLNFHPKLSFYKTVLNHLLYLHQGLFSYNFFTLGLFFCNNCFLFFNFLVCIVWYNSSHGGGKEHVRNLSKRN